MQTSRSTASSKTKKTWQVLFSIGHLLVLTAAILLTVMPWTEIHWHFDRFLRGGQDFEFTLLSILTFLCLVLLLTFLNKQSLSILFVLKVWHWSVFHKADLAPQNSSQWLRDAVGKPDSLHGFACWNSPLRI